MPGKSLVTLFKDAAVRGRIFMILAVFGILIVAILLSGPKPVEYMTDQGTLPAGETAAAPTAKIDKYDTTVTTGVLVGAAAIVLIIEAGTLIELKRHS